MKKIGENIMNRKILILALLLIFLLPISVDAANPKLVRLNHNTTYTKYDVTGNGTKDKFKYVVNGSSGYGYTCLYLNGTKRNTMMTAKGGNIALVSFDSKNVFLAIEHVPYGGHELNIYKYSNKKFANVYSDSKFYNNCKYLSPSQLSVSKVSGKTLYVNCKVTKAFHLNQIPTFKKTKKIFSWDMPYTVKSGKIVLASRTAIVKGTPTFTAGTTFKTATSAPTGKYKSFTIKKGDKVKLMKIYFPSGGKKVWYKVKKGSKQGWFQDSSSRLLK